ncbi:MAG: histidine kinase, partial [Desulfobacterales bacterium]|nr:histidine kinase [Desulfobacterales bacterium]
PGIPGKILDKIINPFFSTKPPGQGTGLGLSISHGLIEAHGGKLRFESVKGEYTMVIVDLPVERGERE